MTMLGTFRRTLFGMPSEKAVFSRQGFVKEAWLRFQPVAHAVVEGYHATLEDSRLATLLPRLEAVEPGLRGFAKKKKKKKIKKKRYKKVKRKVIDE